MGAISVEQLLPKHILQPDDASPISALGLPVTGAVTRIGFDRKPGKALAFEGETRVKFRLQQRTWYYRLKTQATKGEREAVKECESSRLRLEIVVDARNPGPLLPGHHVVIAQIPYSSGWVQAVPLKRYSKKKRDPRELRENAPVFEDMKAVEKQLESAYTFDLWETASNYVAGISFENGYQDLLGSSARNAPTDYVFGVCADFGALRNELLACKEIQRLRRLTEKGTIAFWKLDAAEPKPRLLETTKQAASSLLMAAVQQALAGPRRFSDEWYGQPVWKLVEYLYCNHLNNCNRKASRRREEQFNESLKRLL